MKKQSPFLALIVVAAMSTVSCSKKEAPKISHLRQTKIFMEELLRKELVCRLKVLNLSRALVAVKMLYLAVYNGIKPVLSPDQMENFL